MTLPQTPQSIVPLRLLRESQPRLKEVLMNIPIPKAEKFWKTLPPKTIYTARKYMTEQQTKTFWRARPISWSMAGMETRLKI